MPYFGLPIGTPAPEFSLPGLHGETLTLQALRSSGRPVMLVFSDPNCGPCQLLMPDVGGWQASRANDLTIAVLSRGDIEANRAKTSEHLVSNVLLQDDVEVAELYRFNGTPNAVIIDVEGRISSAMAAGVPAIQQLASDHFAASDATAGQSARRELIPVEAVVPSPIGRQAAPFDLPDLAGKHTSLDDFAGQSLLMLFWNPGCGFCSQILDELRLLERTALERDVPFVVVSAGSVEDNRAMGLTSPVLIDEGFATGNAYGAQGTPSAIVIDAAGLIASELSVGGPAVLALADGITAEGNQAPHSH
jgi:peroxiredoxin